jgi:hypothetical protein
MTAKKRLSRTTTKGPVEKRKAEPVRKSEKNRGPTKVQLFRFLEKALPAKTVTITIQGVLDNCSAAADRVVDAGMTGGPPRWTGSVFTGPGDHELIWGVTGRPGTAYTVSLGGGAAPWSDTFTVPDDGDQAGFKDFKVRP